LVVSKPYSYIAAQRLLALRDQYGFTVNVRIVRPLAVRSPEFFEERDSRWIHYVLIDVAREAERLGLPISAPSPDPIAQDLGTLKIALSSRASPISTDWAFWRRKPATGWRISPPPAGASGAAPARAMKHPGLMTARWMKPLTRLDWTRTG
jgi:hypothetical protein